MIARLLATWILSSTIAVAQEPSQPPTPTPAEKSQPQQQEPTRPGTATNEQNTAPSQSVVVTINQPPANGETDRPRNQSEQQNQDSSPYGWLYGLLPAWVQAGAAIALLFLTAGLIYVAVQQRQTSETQAAILKETLAANKIIERAYIKMAHAPKPSLNPNGGRFDFVTPTGGTKTEAWFKYGVKNCGRTPCNVLGGGIWYVTDTQDRHPPSAPIPPRTPIRVDPTFLVPDMATSDRTVLFIETTTVNNVRSGVEHLWLLGYVDYKDRFGDFHRAGYGRHYDHNSMDLVFDRTTAPFNYDESLGQAEREQYKT